MQIKLFHKLLGAFIVASLANVVLFASIAHWTMGRSFLQYINDAREQRLELTPVGFELLHALARHPERVYRRQELLDLIYEDFRDVSDRTIDSHIKNLRRKLESALPKQQVIHSVYGVGYKPEID